MLLFFSKRQILGQTLAFQPQMYSRRRVCRVSHIWERAPRELYSCSWNIDWTELNQTSFLTCLAWYRPFLFISKKTPQKVMYKIWPSSHEHEDRKLNWTMCTTTRRRTLTMAVTHPGTNAHNCSLTSNKVHKTIG